MHPKTTSHVFSSTSSLGMSSVATTLQLPKSSSDTKASNSSASFLFRKPCPLVVAEVVVLLTPLL
jgi:hypothetical protein